MSYHKERMNLHLTPVWPRPPICDVTVPYVPPPAAPSTSLTPTRRDGLKRCVQIWNMNAIKVLSSSALQPDKCASRRSVPAQMSARYGPDVSVKSLFASPTSLSFLQNHRIYNQIKREISYLCSSSTTSFFFHFTLFFHSFFVIFTHSSPLSTKTKKKKKMEKSKLQIIGSFFFGRFSGRQFEPCWTAVRHNTVEMITEKQRKKNTKFKAWITDITSYNSVFGRIMEESIHPDSCAQPPFQKKKKLGRREKKTCGLLSTPVTWWRTRHDSDLGVKMQRWRRMLWSRRNKWCIQLL